MTAQNVLGKPALAQTIIGELGPEPSQLQRVELEIDFTLLLNEFFNCFLEFGPRGKNLQKLDPLLLRELRCSAVVLVYLCDILPAHAHVNDGPHVLDEVLVLLERRTGEVARQLGVVLENGAGYLHERRLFLLIGVHWHGE